MIKGFKAFVFRGNVIDLAPGVVGVLHPSDETTWVITEPLRKVWIVRSSD